MSTFSYPYATYFPSAYQELPPKKWPLIVFLHGAGERGNDLQKVKLQGLPALLEKKDLPFIVVYPQCPVRQYWSVEWLNNWLNDVTEKLKDHIDLEKIYLTGISMGGYGTWHWAATTPNRFAAIAPICGGGDPSQAYRLKDVPIWAFHGAKDYIVPLEETLAMTEAVKKAGGNVKLTIYPDAAHDSWTETYQNPLLYDWFLMYHR